MPNKALEDALCEARWSLHDLARAVRAVAAEAGAQLKTNHSAARQWVLGRKPNEKTAGYIAEAFSRRLRRHITASDLGLTHTTEQAQEAQVGCALGPDPVETLARLGSADMDRRELVTSAAYSVAAATLPLDTTQELTGRVSTARHRGVVGAAEVEAVQDMTAMFVALDERHGGQHGRSAVAQYLRSDVTDLCTSTFRTPRDRTGMLLAAASLAYLLAWKAFDAGEHGLCQRYYLQCYQLTRAAESEPHQAFILRGMAHHGLDTGHPQHCVDLADAAMARARGHVDPATEALMVVCRARALAADGHGTAALAEADRAAALATRADDQERVANWSALWGPSAATIARHTAKIHIQLRRFPDAERYYTRAARTYGRGKNHARVAALARFDLAAVQFRQGHVERACATWQDALTLLDGVRSQRATHAVTGMRRQLAGLSHRGIRAVTALDERARVWLADHR